MRRRAHSGWIAVFLALLLGSTAQADPLARPGDMQLRHDIKLLVDERVINIPVSAWPIPWGDIHDQLNRVAEVPKSDAIGGAMRRLRERSRWELDGDGYYLTGWASAAAEPRVIRTFENTPRENAEAGLAYSWTGDFLTLNLSASYANDPVDGDEFRPDDSYVGAVFGNWMLSAGWQQRWWGPGNDGSLILSTNARPRPGISLQRNLSTPFRTKWLRWIGPWTLTTFMEQLDGERVVNDALLWGFRVSAVPLPGLEIGVSRTAQWCGDGRPCDLGTFVDVLLGNDNGGANVAIEDEPGNQLGGIDIRWSLPKQIPVALYMQWIGEDGKQFGRPLGSYLRQAGAEWWGRIGGMTHRTYVEWSDTACKTGGFGFSNAEENCAYNHPLYPTGYRYNKRAIGHGVDGDGRSYSLGSTLVQSAGHTWNVILRYMDINRFETPDLHHSLSATPQVRADIQVSHERWTRYGQFYIGIGYSYIDDKATASDESNLTGFIRWSTR